MAPVGEEMELGPCGSCNIETEGLCKCTSCRALLCLQCTMEGQFDARTLCVDCLADAIEREVSHSDEEEDDDYEDHDYRREEKIWIFEEDGEELFED